MKLIGESAKSREKRDQTKRTSDAPKNQYIFYDLQKYFFESQKKLQKMYGFLLVIKDSENPSAAVGLTKKAKDIPPYYLKSTKKV